MRTVARLTSSLPIGILLLGAGACSSPSAPTRVADENTSVITVAPAAQEDMLPGVGQAITMGTEAVNGAAAVRAVYFAVAVSAGLDRYRNDITGFAVGTNLHGHLERCGHGLREQGRRVLQRGQLVLRGREHAIRRLCALVGL